MSKYLSKGPAEEQEKVRLHAHEVHFKMHCIKFQTDSLSKVSHIGLTLFPNS